MATRTNETPDPITPFDEAVFAIAGKSTLLWPRPFGYSARIDAAARGEAVEEWPVASIDLITLEGDA